MRSRPGEVAARLGLALGLMAVLGWPTLATIREAWREPGVGTGGWARPAGLALETIRLVAAVEAIALPAGVALALLLFRTDLRGRRAMLGLLAVSMFVPMPLHATAWLGAFGNLGRAQAIGEVPVLVGWFGAAVVHAMAALPWVVFLAGVALRSVEPELEEAALLDLPAWRVVLRVTLRRGIGGIVAAGLAVAVLTAGDMTVTDLVLVRTYAEEAYLRAQLGQGPGAVAVVALPPLVVLGGCLLLAVRVLLRADPARLPSPALRARVWRLGPWRTALGVGIVGVVGFLVGLPLYGLVWRAGRVGGSAALGRGPHWSSRGLIETLQGTAGEVLGPPGYLLWESILWAALGASVAVALAWPLAWESRRPGPWRWIAAACVALGLSCPGPVAGVALVLAYVRVGPIYDTPAILVLAYAMRTLPYALLVLWPSLRSVPEAYLESAALDGHGPWGQARRVVWPLTRGPTFAAWGVAFVLAMGELPAANAVEPPGTTTLTKRIWELLHTGVESHLAGFALIMLLFLAIAGFLVAWALGRVYAESPVAGRDRRG